MNTLKTEKQEMAIAALFEGSSIRSVERMTGVHRDTIMRFMVRVGQNCEKILHTHMHNLKCKNIEVDEIWSFVGKKQRHMTEDDNPDTVGDQWVFVALDADSKLIPSYMVGKRTADNAEVFMKDLVGRLD